MKQKKFTIWYSDGQGLEQWAFNMTEAVIKSMAKRINDAKPYDIDSIEDEKGVHFEIVDHLRFEQMKLM